MAEIKLSPVKYVNPLNLKPNDINKQYFKQVEAHELKTLMADIKARGVLVPAIAKKGGTLLAGHNRRMCAIQLGLESMPVQYVAGPLTEQEEIAFIIKDNLLRRHLSFDERKQLYKKLIKNFDERILESGKSGIGVTPREVAEATGINPKTIGYDLNYIRHQKKKEIAASMAVDVRNEKAIEAYKRAVSKMINTAIVEQGSTIEAFIELTELARERLDTIQAGHAKVVTA